MNTDRYKKSYSNRSAQRGSVDGLVGGNINRHVGYSSRSTPVPSAQLEKPAIAPSPARRPIQQSQRSPKRQGPVLQPPVLPEPFEIVPDVASAQLQISIDDASARPKLVVGKRRRIRRTAGRVLVSLVAVLFITGVVVSWWGYAAAGKVLSGTTTVAVLSDKKVTPTLLKGEGDGRVNILLMGIGGAGHDGGDLTDTIILASVDPVNHKVVLLSIPRDLWVKMPAGYFGSYQKINAAYSAGKYDFLGKADQSNTDTAAIQAGLTNVDTVVKQVLGTNIDYHVLVNFAAFAQAVDSVHGVTVDVKKPLVDATMAWENNNNATLVPAGEQQMDGKKALLYVRSRHSTSDFDRSERQRQLLVALKHKVLSAGTFSNPAKLDGLSQAFGKNVYSDMSVKGAMRLYDILKDIDDSDVQSIDLVTAPHNFVTTDTVGTSSVVRPKLGFDAYSDIQTYIRSQLRDGYLASENSPLLVVAATEGQIASTRAILTDYGYNVAGTQTVKAPIEQTTVVDLSNGKAPYTRNYLEKRYNTKAVGQLPASVVVPDGTQFVILVGT